MVGSFNSSASKGLTFLSTSCVSECSYANKINGMHICMSLCDRINFILTAAQIASLSTLNTLLFFTLIHHPSIWSTDLYTSSLEQFDRTCKIIALPHCLIPNNHHDTSLVNLLFLRWSRLWFTFPAVLWSYPWYLDHPTWGAASMTVVLS